MNMKVWKPSKIIVYNSYKEIFECRMGPKLLESSKNLSVLAKRYPTAWISVEAFKEANSSIS